MKTFTITYILHTQTKKTVVEAENQRLALKAFKVVTPEVVYKLLFIESIESV